MNEKRQRDFALFAAMGVLDIDDPPLTQTDTPSFDAGARPVESRGAPAPPSWATGESGGWRETEVEDGAALLFPWIEDERG